MAKKRRKPKKGPKRRPRKGFDKRFVPIAFVAAFILIVLLLSQNKPAGKVIITKLETEEGDPSYIYFDMKHTFSTERECYAEVTLFRNNKVISNNVESLGCVEPNQVVSRSISIQFPAGDIDYKVEINCK